LLCHKSKRSHKILLALKTPSAFKWSHTSYKFHFEPLHNYKDKDAACAKYPWDSMSKLTAIAKSLILLCYKIIFMGKWNSGGTNCDPLKGF